VHKADNLPPSCAVVTKSGNLNFLEPSGPVQACNGPALLLEMCLFYRYVAMYRFATLYLPVLMLLWTHIWHIVITVLELRL